jgi:hypothetical protein
MVVPGCGVLGAPVANSPPDGTIGFRAGVMVLTTTPDITHHRSR